MSENRTLMTGAAPGRRETVGARMIVRPLVCPVLVARREELAELVERRRAASRGHGSAALVAGEAGIGKSRLVAEFRDTVSHGRAAIGFAVCREVGNVPYGPLT